MISDRIVYCFVVGNSETPCGLEIAVTGRKVSLLGHWRESLACNHLRGGCINGRQGMQEHPFHDVGLAIWSSTSVTVLAGVYVLTGLVGVVMRPATRDVLSQVEPYLTILEVLMVLVAIALVVMMAALYSWAPAHAKTPALAALAFITIFAILTCGAHFVSLTVGRRIDERGPSVLVRQLSFSQWPTVALSIDLLAWDVFLGLSLLFVAPTFRGDRLQDLLRITMLTGGTLCLSGTLGPALGDLRFQYVAIAGYALFLPVASALLAVFFRRFSKHGATTP